MLNYVLCATVKGDLHLLLAEGIKMLFCVKIENDAKIACILHCSDFSLLVVLLFTILNNLPIKSPMRG